MKPLIISSKTKLCGVIGDPIEHSLSPAMHNSAFHKLGLDYAYLAFHVPKKSLKSAMLGVAGLGIVGVNITIPHKVEVMKLLDHIDETATLIGAVNTVVNRDGRLFGFNTDGAGALRALKENWVGVKGKRIALLGAGGASKAIAFKLSESARSLIILNRTKSKALSLARSLKKIRNIQVDARKLNEENLKSTLSDVDILVNATSVGMFPQINATPIDRDLLHRDLTVFDIVYNPIQTLLLREASERGCKIVNGVDMLVYQGAVSFELWTGESPPIEVMRRVVLDALGTGSGP